MTANEGEQPDRTEQLELPLSQPQSSPFSAKVLRTPPVPPTPPRIPPADQRIIQALSIASVGAALLTVGGMVVIDPVRDATRALLVSAALAVAVSCGLTAMLLLRSFRRYPGVWRVRRRRSLRRGLLVGRLLGGYLALRISGLGGPTGLLIAALLIAIAEVAISRSEIDSV